MEITLFSFIASMLWGSCFAGIIILLRRYLLAHRAYLALCIFSLVASLRFLFIFEMHFLSKGFSNIVNERLWDIKDKVPRFLEFQQTQTYGLCVFVLFAVWVSIGLYLIFIDLRDYYRFSRLVNQVPPSDNVDVQRTLARLKAEMDISKDVNVIQDESIQVPKIMGFFRPTIFLNTNLPDETGLYATLRHELVHFVHHDAWLKLAIHCVRLFLWWNPWIRYLERVLSEACELRCDCRVTENMCLAERKGYAKLIVDTARRQKALQEPHVFGLASAMPGRNRRFISLRIEEILCGKVSVSQSVSVSLVIAFVSLLGCTTMAFSLPLVSQQLKRLPDIMTTDFSVYESCVVHKNDGSYWLFCDGKYVIDVDLEYAHEMGLPIITDDIER